MARYKLPCSFKRGNEGWQIVDVNGVMMADGMEPRIVTLFCIAINAHDALVKAAMAVLEFADTREMADPFGHPQGLPDEAIKLCQIALQLVVPEVPVPLGPADPIDPAHRYGG